MQRRNSHVKTERFAIHSWRYIERVTCQQLIGSLKRVKNFGNFSRVVIRFFSLVEIPFEHSSLYNKCISFVYNIGAIAMLPLLLPSLLVSHSSKCYGRSCTGTEFLRATNLNPAFSTLLQYFLTHPHRSQRYRCLDKSSFCI